VTTTNNVSRSCDIPISIVNPPGVISPCYLFYTSYFRWFPSHIFINAVRPGTPIPFELKIVKTQDIKKQISGQLNIVLSKDQVISKEDKVLFTKGIKLKNKETSTAMDSKFLIPSDIDLGEYYLLVDVISTDKKEQIGFEKFVQKMTIGSQVISQDTITPRSKKDLGNITISPNPFSDNLKIETSIDQPISINIFDAYGKLCIKQNSNTSVSDIGVSNLPSGIYFVKISSVNDYGQVYKIVKSN
jgi:hypothetical protein